MQLRFFLCHKSSCRVCNGSGSTGYCYGYIDCCEYFLKFGQMANEALKKCTYCVRKHRLCCK
ncbi:hypothetical protein DU121_21895 [Salmonella enterica subsp. salamae]|nr:hypothetical protein [Salmonella enterica]ECF5834298.1 hypothetical protein [Salmonella enterica subsp. salamae]ECF5995519.1 hypothetical protein [Salmonella enterica subsp. salamae]ECG1598203.1 hypothetical protein [Salmonella enterica subsp. salamae]ECH1406535.1 hypothetical protein [Salmonella enterica subsp. salamae]